MWPIPPPMKKITPPELKIISFLFIFLFFLALGLVVYLLLRDGEVPFESIISLIILGAVTFIIQLEIRRNL